MYFKSDLTANGILEWRSCGGDIWCVGKAERVSNWKASTLGPRLWKACVTEGVHLGVNWDNVVLWSDRRPGEVGTLWGKLGNLVMVWLVLKWDGRTSLRFSRHLVEVDESEGMREELGNGRMEFIKPEEFVWEYSDRSACELNFTPGMSSLAGNEVSTLDKMDDIGTLGNVESTSLVFLPCLGWLLTKVGITVVRWSREMLAGVSSWLCCCVLSNTITVSFNVFELLLNCSLRRTKILSMTALSWSKSSSEALIASGVLSICFISSLLPRSLGTRPRAWGVLLVPERTGCRSNYLYHKINLNSKYMFKTIKDLNE